VPTGARLSPWFGHFLREEEVAELSIGAYPYGQKSIRTGTDSEPLDYRPPASRKSRNHACAR